MSGPGALCVGAFCRSLCRGPAVLFRACLGRGPALCVALFVSGPGALCQGPARGPALLVVSGPDALFLGLRPSLSGCVWRPDCFCVGAALFGALCVGARRSPAVNLGRGPTLSGGQFMSGPRALCWRARALCRGPALGAKCAPSESWGPALFVWPGVLCQGPARHLSVGPRRVFCVSGPAAPYVWGFCVFCQNL